MCFGEPKQKPVCSSELAPQTLHTACELLVPPEAERGDLGPEELGGRQLFLVQALQHCLP